MTEVTKIEFERFVAARCPATEPRIERDGAYHYECYDDESGEEIAFVSYCLSAVDGHPDRIYVIKDKDDE